MSRSSGRISTSTSSASGMTATVAVEVWIRPCDSVTGTRCTRWTPDSCFSRPYASRPRMPEHDLLVAAEVRGRRRQHVGLPSAPVREVPVHLEQITGPQGRLLPARAGPDLEDQVLAVVGVLRHEQLFEPGAELLDALAEGERLLEERLGHLRVGLGVGELHRLGLVGGRLPELAIRAGRSGRARRTAGRACASARDRWPPRPWTSRLRPARSGLRSPSGGLRRP